MTLTDDFKEKIKSGQVTEAMTLALSAAIELEITTWVSSAESDQQTTSTSGEPLPSSRMRTCINIVDGQVETEVGSQFIGNGPYTELRQFHMHQVQEGREIIEQNLANLQQMFTILTDTLSRLSQVSDEQVGQQPILSPSNGQDSY